jgi:meso-butanediol dehydrogenase/(S,S)-butanediol dehydrogenase/diacetyl reductase
MRLKDKIAVVTGGGGGLGEGICLRLAGEGAHVVVSDLKADMADKVARKVVEKGCRSLAVVTDVRKPKECRALIDVSLKEMGGIDILVCCAGEGGFGLRGDSDAPAILENISEEQWDLTLDVNLKGVFLCNQAVIPHFKKRKRGKIVNISSIGGRKGIDFIPHYCASKAGVIVLTQAIALQLAAYNVNVNCICPGVIWTPMWETGAKALAYTYPQFKGMAPEKIFEAMMEHMIPLKRAQSPGDIGNAVAFLASDEADQITGQALNVDGGAVFN